jgi:chlorobactene glucosyltransferase
MIRKQTKAWMGQFLFIYNCVIGSALIFLLINYFVNDLLFKDVLGYYKPGSIDAGSPLISVLVPARNEERDIERCIRSLMAQDYPNLEIIVLDDNSTDNTAGILKDISRECSRVRMLDGKPLPPGWVGKNYACFQLEKQARGEYLFFTDADTIHETCSVSSAYLCLKENRLDALSVFPFQVTRSFMEKMIIRYMTLGILLLIPLRLLRKTRLRLFSSALGSLMLYKREVYRAVGGHTSISGLCLEDINMSILLKKMGYDFMIFDGTRTYRTRMYEDLASIIRGVKRFVLTSFNFNAFLGSLSMLFLSMLLLFPFLLLPVSAAADTAQIYYWPNLALNISQVLIIIIIRTAYCLRFNGTLSEILLHPLSIGVLLYLSIYINIYPGKGQSFDWKGRKYTLQQQI